MTEKILIADDDLDTLRLVGLLLQRKGYQIIAANNGRHALDKAVKERPNLILLDVMMPDMDGYTVARQLRKHDVTARIPIIMFTAKSQVDDKVAGFEAGVDDYLTKPTHPAELIARVKAVLARAAAAKHVPSQAAPTHRKRGTVIGVLAAKGGTGVTTVALNLGVALRKVTKNEIAVVDFRPGDGNLSLQIGMPHRASFNELLMQEPALINIQDVENTLVKHEETEIHFLLSSNQPSDAKYSAAVRQAEAITKHVSHLADYMIIDLGPSLPPITDKLIEQCDQLIVVLEPTGNSVLQTKALLDELSFKVLGLGRITLVALKRDTSEFQVSRKKIREQLGHSVALSIVADPEQAYRASDENIPLALLNPAGIIAQQFDQLAEITMQQVRS